MVVGKVTKWREGRGGEEGGREGGREREGGEEERSESKRGGAGWREGGREGERHTTWKRRKSKRRGNAAFFKPDTKQPEEKLTILNNICYTSKRNSKQGSPRNVNTH